MLHVHVQTQCMVHIYILGNFQEYAVHVYSSTFRVLVQVLDDQLSSSSTNQCKTFEVKLLQFDVVIHHYNNTIITNT